MNCPLCDCKSFLSSWFGKTLYNKREFEYVECQSCRTIYCQPMPDGETLARMYGQEYFKNEEDEILPHDFDDRFREPVEWLKKNSPKIILDYGCGAGELLEQAKNLGWNCAGIEFDANVAKIVEDRLGIPVKTNAEKLGTNFQADALHLGDVIEHLTDLKNQMPEILKLLKPGGILLAQGPLEANPNLFTFLLKYSRKLRGRPISSMPPYHVLLATVKGQKLFFERFGLREIEFSISETAHPAPEKVGFADFKKPQKVGLFAARRLSQMISSLNENNWGNRFFYVGEKS